MTRGIASVFSELPNAPVKKKPLSVGDLVFALKNKLESEYGRVLVLGEISSFKPWRSGHWYFDLKDDRALIPAVMFKGQAGKVKFEVEDGMQVVLHGKVSVYPPQSKMQLIVDKIEPVGKGALALAFEQLKQKLDAEGLFDDAHKIPLPYFPRCIGIVTSPQGAALQDMLRILRGRCPGASVLLAPCRVQGDGSAAEIAAAIEKLDASGECDVIIAGRGGGSLEDLWAFNEEAVARAIFACKAPIVSAVGHENDFTIADFVADVRCATPTHAAQAVVPDAAELDAALLQQTRKLARVFHHVLIQNQLRLEELHKRLKDPRSILLPHVQRLEYLSRRLQASSPMRKLEQHKRALQMLNQRMTRIMQHTLSERKRRLHVASASLNAVSPLAVLGRGYAVVFSGGKVVSRVRQVRAGDALRVRVSDGEIAAEVR